MSAWRLNAYGSLDNLFLASDVPKPAITKPREIIVKVAASSLNPIDAAMLGGYGQVLLDAVRSLENCATNDRINLPLTLGRDFSGEVVARGSNVKHVQVGDKVYGVIVPHHQGCQAEYAVVDSDLVAKKPVHLTDEEASSIFYTGMTAWSALKVTGDIFLRGPSGMRALVIGGSGGVGTIAIQLLKNWGVEVTTTCAPDAVPLLQSLNADIVIDYTKHDALKDLEIVGKFDIILDASGVASPNMYLNYLREWKNAKFITLRSPLLSNVDKLGLVGGMAQNALDLALANIKTGAVAKGATVRWGFFMPASAGISEINDMVLDKKIKPVVERVFAFSDMPAAFERMAQGHLRGKLVISKDPSKVTAPAPTSGALR
ncbi:Alcohol dehydrogenase GroES-like domain [Nesidiocoris tenuis]|nr:Alcohol dehydrogenase GroES-like domain [Nesidiocoris tenuis]